VSEAARLGAGKSILARMTFNVVVEGLAGMVPFAGDIFDAAFKANQRNVRLLEQYLSNPVRTRRSSRLMLAGIVAIMLLLAALIVGSGVMLWKSLSS
jgi:hypothetical protein